MLSDSVNNSFVLSLNDSKLHAIVEGRAGYDEGSGVIKAAKEELEKRGTIADKQSTLAASETQGKFAADLRHVINDVEQLLVEKNRKYGNSVFKPINCFSKLSPVEGINIRLDDKIKRLISGQADETEDTELDLLGYLLIKRVWKYRESENRNE